MLDAEEARARLESIIDLDWRAVAAQRVEALSKRKGNGNAKAAAAVAEVFLEPEPDPGSKKAEAFARRLAEAAASLDELPEADRLEVMAAFHPGFGPMLAQWWTAAVGNPFQVGWVRKAFRAPHDPEISRESRTATLRGAVNLFGPYPGHCDAVWLAAWAPHIGQEFGAYRAYLAPGTIGQMLAAAIDGGGDGSGTQVRDTLLAVGAGEHAIGVMGRHVISGLLGAAQPEGWDFVERLLLAAQGQEGLRQSVLEAADEAHPEAFDRLLAVVVEHDLIRFAAAVRAAGVWLGLSADVDDGPRVARYLRQFLTYRTDAAACSDALTNGDGEATFLALFARGQLDVVEALRAAGEVRARPDVDARRAVAGFLAATGLSSSRDVLLDLVDDDDLSVAVAAHAGLQQMNVSELPAHAFERLERLVTRLPESGFVSEPLPATGFPVPSSRSDVLSSMLWALGDRPLDDVLPWVGDMDSNVRMRFAYVAGGIAAPTVSKRRPLTPDVRDVLIRLVTDRSSHVRGAALRALEHAEIDADSVRSLEPMLTRKTADLRRGVIGLLARLPVGDAVAAAERLWATKIQAQRDAACDLLAALPDRPPEAQAQAAAFADDAMSERQGELLAPLLGEVVDDGRDEPGLGLYDPARRAPIPVPSVPKHLGRSVKGRFGSDAALHIVSALDDLAAEHRDVEVRVVSWQGLSDVLLADARNLPSPFMPSWMPMPPASPGAGPDEDPVDQEGSGLVLAELFRGWWADRPAECRGASDELDALRALVAVRSVGAHEAAERSALAARGAYQELPEWLGEMAVELVGTPPTPLRHGPLVEHVLLWLLVDHAGGDTIDECLDALDATLARAAKSHVPEPVDQSQAGPFGFPVYDMHDWRYRFEHYPWLIVVRGLFALGAPGFTADRLTRFFHQRRWLDEPRPNVTRVHLDRRLVLEAHAAGVATDDDVYDLFLNTRPSPLSDFTRLRRQPLTETHPGAIALADRLRDRIVTIEMARGDLETSASPHVTKLRSVIGASTSIELLRRLGRATLVRGYGGQGRDSLYSYLLRHSYPGAGDDAKRLFGLAVEGGVRTDRLVELAMFAPQWAALVEEALDWRGLEDAVWWFHAHTKDDSWRTDVDLRETWAALSAERTPLSGDDLMGGAVDVEWFRRAVSAVGKARWQKLHDLAKLASSGNGHTRAKLFSDAMTGAVGVPALVERIRTKRHQDSVRALGLVPLPKKKGAGYDTELANRYAVLAEFDRGAAKFGAQRQASERAAARVGVENLARTAGYGDPQRFVWAMEAAEAGELADGPIVVDADDVKVTLTIDHEGVADVAVERAGRSLKSIPAKVRKTPVIAELLARKTALVRQSRRVRSALESAMVGQASFVAADLTALDRHPVVSPMLGLSVFVGVEGQTARSAGQHWVDAAGDVVPDFGRQELRLAHPVDLVDRHEWVAWQEQLFAGEQRQPFKQVFRELYVPTADEKGAGPGSLRYAGHQIQPRQALALFGRRGWLADYESGAISRVFHEHGIAARLTMQHGLFTVADVELPTVDTVYFTRPSEAVALPLDSVPTVVFSEAMRDLDLVVSVAHAGGVDPEASASTVEMRVALVRETARVLKLDNVTFAGSHAVIDGRLGEYSVHLGSAVVHRRPGGALCIIPVDRQRRGRVFLPFADDDPKTAEVVAKVILLANDGEIRDPTILSQLRS